MGSASRCGLAQELPLKGIELEWEPVENAFGYEIRLTPKGGGEPLVFKNDGQQIRARCSSGRLYFAYSVARQRGGRSLVALE